MFVGYYTLVAGVIDVVIRFNEGTLGSAAVLRKMNLDIRRNTQTGLVLINRIRVQKADKTAEAITKKVKIKKREEKRKRECRARRQCSLCPRTALKVTYLQFFTVQL